MQRIITILAIVSFFPLGAIIINDGANTYNFSYDDLLSWQRGTIETQREKKGEMCNEVWRGPYLREILKTCNITDYNTIKLVAEDNYLVRLSAEQITENNPIIAVERDGNLLKPEKIRLIVPGIRDMFWIQNIARIQLDQSTLPTMPATVYRAELALSHTPLRTSLPPFTDARGYFLNDLTLGIFPALQGDFVLIGKDGVSHTLDYATYLQRAVLVKDGNSYNLKSPSMPAGMWIKNIAYIQYFDRAIVFDAAFSNWKEVATLAGWDAMNATVEAHSPTKTKTLSASIPLNDAQWTDVEFISLP